MYMFPLSKLYYFKHGTILNNQFESNVYESSSFRLVFSNFIYNDNTPSRPNVQYNENSYYILDRSNIFAGNKPTNKHNRDIFLHLLDQNLKVFIVDIEGDPLFLKNDTISIYDFLEIIDSHEKCEMITSRDFQFQSKYFDFTSNGFHLNNTLLPLLGFYFRLHDKLYIHPTLPEFENTQKKYDFISYTGLSHSINKTANWRRYILSKIDFLDKSIFLPNSFDFNQNYIKRTITNNEPNHGSFNWFSLIESESAKIKIVFETVNPIDSVENYDNFLTEKTLKCFLHSQPYFILMPKKHRILLKKLGFLFPEPGDTVDEQINYINDVCKNDLDDWIDDTKHIFIHNKTLFNDILFSTDTVLMKTFLNFTNTLVR